MSDLKSFLWNNKSSVSVKQNNYASLSFKLRQWPDYGFVGCPAEYITISAYLARHHLDYQQICDLTEASQESVNHFIYVCRMLQIMEMQQHKAEKNRRIKLFSNVFTAKLRAVFFHH